VKVAYGHKEQLPLAYLRHPTQIDTFIEQLPLDFHHAIFFLLQEDVLVVQGRDEKESAPIFLSEFVEVDNRGQQGGCLEYLLLLFLLEIHLQETIIRSQQDLIFHRS